jgi:hypothetical protein
MRPLYEAMVPRQQADQIYNLSLTRTATKTLLAPGTRGVIGIGRVKTPTLAIVCLRELESVISNRKTISRSRPPPRPKAALFSSATRAARSTPPTIALQVIQPGLSATRNEAGNGLGVIAGRVHLPFPSVSAI